MKFWLQLLLAIVLGFITGTVIAHYRDHSTITSTPIPTGGMDTHDSNQGDCGSYYDEEECGT